MRSKYIVIEGLEGAGKTTARNVVVETLVFTIFPLTH